MSLTRFAVVRAFGAWSPKDRDDPDRRVSILPGVRDLFTENVENAGVFVKFLKSGSWYETERLEFEQSTQAVTEHEVLSARAGC
jgi:hypothetical protein